MSIGVYGNMNKAFFDDISNSQAFKYASKHEIERIDIFMDPRL